MAFKEKLKGAWRRVSNLDDETQSIRRKVDDRIPYKVISKKLKEIMEQNVDVVGRRILIPNFYTIYFNESDRNMRLEVEDVMCNELKEELFHEMRKINPEQSKGDVVISVNTDPAIEKGQFKVVHRMKKPSREEERLSLDKTASEIMPPPDENDLQQTIVEAAPDFTAADEQQTIVQMPEGSVLYKLLIHTDDGTNEQLVTKEMVTIGRSSQDDVVLESSDFSISRAHATLEVRDDMYYLTPVGINGTFVNGEEMELKKEVQVFPEDEIKIMSYRLIIKAG
ncbi:DUF3662 domain-containing protein [candidate division KSB1 bacterium]|nr:DUF3662 domain-containing protein [candidate division KSB1 bacterium]